MEQAALAQSPRLPGSQFPCTPGCHFHLHKQQKVTLHEAPLLDEIGVHVAKDNPRCVQQDFYISITGFLGIRL